MNSTPRVAYFCPVWGRKGPLQLGWSDYWRLALPAVELHRNGWDVVLGRAVGPADGGRLSVCDPNGAWWSDRDVLVFHRWMSKDAARLVRDARAAGQVLINDVDDLLWEMPPDHPGHEQMSRPDYNLDNWLGTLREASLITVSTPYLAEASDFGPPVRLVRNYVDLRAWEERPAGRYVGWVGSTAGRAEDLRVLGAVTSYLAERGEPLYHGGVMPGDPVLSEILGHPTVTRPFQLPTTYPRLWDPLRVALCPLGPGAFSQAKSWVKPLEACARGIPFIATDCPEYRELGTGRLAGSPEEWVWHLKALEDPTVYAADQKVNRSCAKLLTIEGNVGAWADLITQAATEERDVVLQPS